MSAEWWRGACIYQIYPRSFADSNDDGIGDLPGITARLPYVASLGVDAIWLSPFFTSPMRDFGYDVADYCNVDPIFGTLADFDALLGCAHGLGLKVIIDQVYSHTSDQHPWFRESRADRANPRSDWYVWADPKSDGSPPSNWQSVFGGPAWTWDARRRQYYLHNFLTEQPDLNVHHGAVQEALLEVARFWLERGVDGFRVDAIDYAMHDPQLTDNPPSAADGRSRTRPVDFQQPRNNKSHPDIVRFVERVRALTERYRGRFTVAEVGGEDGEPAMKAFTAGGRRFHSAYGFNFLYAPTLTAPLVRAALEAWPEGQGTGWPSWAFSNHDAPRAVSRWAEPQDRRACARATLLLLVCLRGNIFLYQGEELGLPQATLAYTDLKDPEALSNWPQTLGRDGARTPMPWVAGAANAGFSRVRPWLPVAEAHLPLAVDRQELEPTSQLVLSRRLLGLRRRLPALRGGALRVLEADGDILVFERGAGELLCAFNFGRQSHALRSVAPGAWRVLEAVGGAGMWTLPPWSGLIAQRPLP
ncbi:MAG TPA: alpha-amylase family glycosyl hydrolase [Candidatus Dormibacteraeota bacterium]|nr:alpha-amylase family glycosyl hydrolase [Candidatus Dormibacteraeota bacterium]